MDATDEVIGIMDRKQRDMARRIRELEAELQVRDNMGNEVLRILREATGKRDFHSEIEAAEHAAKMLAEAQLDSARLDAAERGKFSIRNNAMSDKWEVTTGDLHPAHRRSVSRKTLRAAIDEAMEEEK